MRPSKSFVMLTESIHYVNGILAKWIYGILMQRLQYVEAGVDRFLTTEAMKGCLHLQEGVLFSLLCATHSQTYEHDVFVFPADKNLNLGQTSTMGHLF